MARGSRRRHRVFAVFSRSLGAATGIAFAAAGIVAMQLPFVNRPAAASVSLTRLAPSASHSLVWPASGPAAIDIPSLGVVESHNDQVVPIASLTKMMTAYLVLEKMPLGVGETGPCMTVSATDVANYQSMIALDESSVPVALGEQLCEVDLLNGLLVHSAGNYAVMLADMVDGSTTTFITEMNATAVSLGLTHTHYDDVSGLSPLSVSTASDQVRLATLLMKSALVRSIVIQPSVTLPVAGTVGSYTPYVGTQGVIGVKSGRTTEAGGCDAIAKTFSVGAGTEVAYAVVLNQRGGDLLGPAGVAALDLVNSAIAARTHVVLGTRHAVAHLAFRGTGSVAIVPAHRVDLSWWMAGTAPSLSYSWREVTGDVRAGERVGTLVVRGAASARVALIAAHPLKAPTILQRIR